MEFNLFSWIREGVKRSVILGVSDAVEAIGTTHDDDKVQERLGLLLAVPGAEAEPALAGGAVKRKRLGRSLRDFDSAS